MMVKPVLCLIIYVSHVNTISAFTIRSFRASDNSGVRIPKEQRPTENVVGMESPSWVRMVSAYPPLYHTDATCSIVKRHKTQTAQYPNKAQTTQNKNPYIIRSAFCVLRFVKFVWSLSIVLCAFIAFVRRTKADKYPKARKEAKEPPAPREIRRDRKTRGRRERKAE